MIDTVYTVRCDRCRWWDVGTQGPTRAEAVANAQMIGWSVTHRRHLCRWCSEQAG